MNETSLPTVEVLDDDVGCQALDAELVERVYEFNVQATGRADGRLLAGRIRDAARGLVAAFSGHTWGGVCVLTHVWVADAWRRRGLGRRLLAQAESEAVRRGCAEVILLTHDFQAPGFYERAGYHHAASIPDWPLGHANLVYRKRLTCEPR